MRSAVLLLPGLIVAAAAVFFLARAGGQAPRPEAAGRAEIPAIAWSGDHDAALALALGFIGTDGTVLEEPRLLGFEPAPAFLQAMRRVR